MLSVVLCCIVSCCVMLNVVVVVVVVVVADPHYGEKRKHDLFSCFVDLPCSSSRSQQQDSTTHEKEKAFVVKPSLVRPQCHHAAKQSDTYPQGFDGRRKPYSKTQGVGPRILNP